MSASESEAEEYEVLKVLDERKVDGKRQFLIKWKDGSKKWSKDKYDEWKDESEMACPDLVEEFKEKRRRKRESHRSRKERSTSNERRAAKEEKKVRKATSKREEERKSDGEDSDVPRSSSKSKKKKVIIDDSDDNEETVEPPSTSRDIVKNKSRTEVDKLRESGDAPPSSSSSSSRQESRELSSSSHQESREVSSSSRLDSREPSSSSALLAEIKREEESPQKQKELRSDVTKNLNKVKRTPAEDKQWKKIKKMEKMKNQKNPSRKAAAPLQQPFGDRADGQPMSPLFQSSPNKNIKTELHDEVEGAERKERFSDLHRTVDRGMPAMRCVKEEERREMETSHIGGNEKMEVDQQSAKEEKEGRGHGEVEDKDEKKKESKKKEEEDELCGDEEEGEVEKYEESEEDLNKRFNIITDPCDQNGYEKKLTGVIVGHETLEFDNGEVMTFMRVLFKSLKASQYIRHDIVEEKDPMGYRMYLKEMMGKRERKRIKKSAARYRRERDAAVAAAATV